MISLARKLNQNKCYIVQVIICISLIGKLTWYTRSRPQNLKQLAKHVIEQIPNPTGLNPFNTPSAEDSYVNILNIPKPRVRTPNGTVNCRRLFIGTEDGQKYEKFNPLEWHPGDEYFINATKDCKQFIKQRQYIMQPISQEEAEFPLAFSLVVYKTVHQVEQLLRVIYRPQNYYCIHVDKKAKPVIYDALSNISQCFDNVFMASQRHSVRWGEFSVIEPELTCMEDLWNKSKWKYFINLTGQEFPLKTNLDIIQILKVYNGSNAIGWDHRNFIAFKRRVQFRYPRVNSPRGVKEPPPHGIKITFGGVHVALVRSFVGFLLHNQIAADFKKWVRDTNFPDETYIQSLHVNPQLGVPGAFTGDPKGRWETHNPFIRYKRWFSCRPRSRITRNICILGVADMVDLIRAHDMFANKFFADHQPLARMCLEELIFNRTRSQVHGGSKLNLQPYYRPLFVMHHNPS